MRRYTIATAALLAISLATAIPVAAQSPTLSGDIASSHVLSAKPRGHVEIPASSIEQAGDIGKRAHTNVRIFVPDEKITVRNGKVVHENGGGASGAGYFETPQSLACDYKLVKQTPGCNPILTLTAATGGSKAIAIVDAFDNQWAAVDLINYAASFSLPAPANFQVVYATGKQPPPPQNVGWIVESALDIEMAYAMAPNAKIYLVEAASDSYSDLLFAVKVASKLVAEAGGGEVSMSWGGSEWPGETAYDSVFTTPGVVYFAASGDAPGTQTPAVSPNVVAVGGTALRRDAVSGNLLVPGSWIYAGGGSSSYEARPSYQAGISSIVGSHRGVPDLAAVADLNTGVFMYAVLPFPYFGGILVVGGTSVATPLVAGIVNNAGSFASSTNAELTTIYSNMGVTTDFLDISKGYCGLYAGDAAVKGWDFCTGVGSPEGLKGK